MNIRTLGDLVRTTEAELLAYKNFGETCLKEIKDMLAAKGLRLGQALEEGSELADRPDEAGHRVQRRHPGDAPRAHPVLDPRRRALESLKIATLGELISKSEPNCWAEELRTDQPQRNPPAAQRVRPEPPRFRLT